MTRRCAADTFVAITRLIRACFVAALALLIPIADASAQSAPSSPVTFLVQGKGWGHGRGLGQWGALGYALKGWTSAQILDHFYGATTPGAVDAASEVRVRLLREDDVDVIVMSERNVLSTGVTPGVFTALRAQPQPDGTYSAAVRSRVRRSVDCHRDRAVRRLPHRSGRTDERRPERAPRDV